MTDVPSNSKPKRPKAADKAQVVPIILARVRDSEALIAAAKVQRWDVMKWATTLNVALGTASVTIGGGHWVFIVFAVLTAVMGVLLVLHYNRRATRARKTLKQLHAYVADHVFDVKSILECDAPVKTAAYDLTELLLFVMAMIASVFVTVTASILAACAGAWGVGW